MVCWPDKTPRSPSMRFWALLAVILLDCQVTLVTCISCVDKGAVDSSFPTCCLCASDPELYLCPLKCPENTYPVNYTVRTCAKGLGVSTSDSEAAKPRLGHDTAHLTSGKDLTTVVHADTKTDDPPTPPPPHPPQTTHPSPLTSTAHDDPIQDGGGSSGGGGEVAPAVLRTCSACDRACQGCTGPGPDRCRRCAPGCEEARDAPGSCQCARGADETAVIPMLLGAVVGLVLIVFGLSVFLRLRKSEIKQLKKRRNTSVRSPTKSQNRNAPPWVYPDPEDPAHKPGAVHTALTNLSVYHELNSLRSYKKEHAEKAPTSRNVRKTRFAKFLEKTHAHNIARPSGLIPDHETPIVSEIDICPESDSEYRLSWVPLLGSSDETNPKLPSQEMSTSLIHSAEAVLEPRHTDATPPLLPPRNTMPAENTNTGEQVETSQAKTPATTGNEASKPLDKDAAALCPDSLAKQPGSHDDSPTKNNTCPNYPTEFETSSDTSDRERETVQLNSMSESNKNETANGSDTTLAAHLNEGRNGCSLTALHAQGSQDSGTQHPVSSCSNKSHDREDARPSYEKSLSPTRPSLLSLAEEHDYSQPFSHGLYFSTPETEENCRPSFSVQWQKEQVVSHLGGVVRTEGSAVSLEVPPGAVLQGNGVTVQASVSTHLEQVYSKLDLPAEEHVASPIAEYFAGPSFRFHRPVRIVLPHFLPRRRSPEEVQVYVFHRQPTGHLSLGKLTPRSEDGGTVEDTDVYSFLDDGRLEIFTNHFSGYFCTTCQKERVAQDLNLVLFGRHVQKASGKCLADLRLELWDNRLEVPDFEQACFQRVCSLNEQDMQYVDRKSLAAPEDNLEVQTLGIGCQLELSTEEEGPAWTHATRGHDRLVHPVRSAIPLKTMFPCDCYRPSIPKTVDWRVTSIQESSLPDCFECLVDVGYVLTDQLQLSQPMNFLESPAQVTFVVSLAPTQVQAENGTSTSAVPGRMDRLSRPTPPLGLPETMLDPVERGDQWPSSAQVSRRLPTTIPGGGLARTGTSPDDASPHHNMPGSTAAGLSAYSLPTLANGGMGGFFGAANGGGPVIHNTDTVNFNMVYGSLESCSYGGSPAASSNPTIGQRASTASLTLSSHSTVKKRHSDYHDSRFDLTDHADRPLGTPSSGQSGGNDDSKEPHGHQESGRSDGGAPISSPEQDQSHVEWDQSHSHTPNGISHMPNGISHTPNGISHTPNWISHTPNGISHTPNGISHTPNGISHTPNGISHTPNGISHTPNGINHTPNGISHTPDGISHTAIRRMESVTQPHAERDQPHAEQDQSHAEQDQSHAEQDQPVD